MKMKKLLVALLAFALLATGTLGNTIHIQAAGDPTIYITDDVNLVVTPGETNHIKLPIQTVGGFIPSPTMEITADAGAPFTFTRPTISLNSNAAQGIYTSTPVYLEFDVKVKETASIKDYGVQIKFTYEDFLNNEIKSYTLNTTIKVQAEKTPAQLTISNVVLDDTKLGSKTNISFTITNEGELTAKSSYLVMDFKNAFNEGYTATKIKIGDLAAGATKNISLPITILSNATAGRNSITGNFTYKTVDGGEALTSAYTFYVNLSTNASAPKLTVEDVKYGDSLKPGNDFTLSLNLKNSGSGKANGITATIDDASVTTDGIIKNYFTDGISVSNINKGKSETVKLPLTVSKYATGGMKALKVVVNYKDDSGIAYTLTETVYVDVVAATTAGTPNLVISNVEQSPSKPNAGGQVDISFELENKSKVDISELKVYADGLTNATFIPVESEPYQYIEKLKGGDKVRITIPLNLSKSIPEGLNNLTIKYKYTGGEDTVIIPVHDVQNDFGSGSKPKLIVSKYTTDVEQLRAGSTFNFTYDIYNTNASVAAKNITVTITQADNIFTVTQGSNSFFINKIEPGETIENTIELKVKSDATTKAYPLKITIEYEYEGMQPNPETGVEGVTKTEELNLQAVENARPVADNIQVYSWDGNVMVGGTATLSFEFYNMGKSVLSNVTATLEGDGFTKADGSMYFIGNVEAGSSTLVEFDVIPNMEGTIPGTLKISYEDSNGDTVEFNKDFEGTVMGAGVVDPGTIPDGSGEVFNPEVSTAKAAILPTWAFVLLQVAIFILFVPITRKIIISAYKSKLRKKEQEQY